MNNLKIIKPFLVFESEDDFYLLEIIKRRKENPKLETGEIKICSYFIISIKELDNLMPEIIKICDATSSRAYINLNARSFKKIALHTNKKIGDLLLCGDYKAVRKSYLSSCHSFSKNKNSNKVWVIDFDFVDKNPSTDDLKKFDSVKKKLFELQKVIGIIPLLTEIPTKNGIHLITRPFNVKNFNDEFPDVKVHKDNFTLCYINS